MQLPVFARLTNRTNRELIAGLIPGYGARQMTYDPRRPRPEGFIQRIRRTQRYQADQRETPTGRLVHQHLRADRQPALAELDPKLPAEIATRSPLACSWRAADRAIDTKIRQAAIAA